jgi:hypothetical protein
MWLKETDGLAIEAPLEKIEAPQFYFSTAKRLFETNMQRHKKSFEGTAQFSLEAAGAKPANSNSKSETNKSRHAS